MMAILSYHPLIVRVALADSTHRGILSNPLTMSSLTVFHACVCLPSAQGYIDCHGSRDDSKCCQPRRAW